MAPHGLGGRKSLNKYIASHIHYPQEARKEGVQGRISIMFIVNEKGYVDKKSVTVLKGLGNGMDKEAVRVIKMLPRFEPATNNGHPVKFLYTVPIIFSLSN